MRKPRILSQSNLKLSIFVHAAAFFIFANAYKKYSKGFSIRSKVSDFVDLKECLRLSK